MKQQSTIPFLSFFSFFFLPLFLPNFVVSNCFLVATILSHRYNSRTSSGETKVESHASSDTQAALLLNTARIQPGSQLHQCVGGNTVHLATFVSVPGPPQELLVRDETRISLPANPFLTRATLGQLCVAPRISRLQPVTKEPGREPSLWWHSWCCSTAPLTTAPPGRQAQST